MSRKTNRKYEGLVMKYFVLNPHNNDLRGRASRAAIYRYAEEIEKEEPEFANDLKLWVKGIF